VADLLGMPVIYTAQPGDMTRAQRGLLHDFWGPGMDCSADDRLIIAELAPSTQDTVLTKWRYSAFHRTGLTELLARQGRDQLVICGIYAHIGCLMTACDSFTQDIQPFFVADALADFSAADHHMALRYAATRCAVTMTAQNVVGALRAATLKAA
jgi:isochorismate hydrolase